MLLPQALKNAINNNDAEQIKRLFNELKGLNTLVANDNLYLLKHQKVIVKCLDYAVNERATLETIFLFIRSLKDQIDLRGYLVSAVHQKREGLSDALIKHGVAIGDGYYYGNNSYEWNYKVTNEAKTAIRAKCALEKLKNMLRNPNTFRWQNRVRTALVECLQFDPGMVSDFINQITAHEVENPFDLPQWQCLIETLNAVSSEFGGVIKRLHLVNLKNYQHPAQAQTTSSTSSVALSEKQLQAIQEKAEQTVNILMQVSSPADLETLLHYVANDMGNTMSNQTNAEVLLANRQSLYQYYLANPKEITPLKSSQVYAVSEAYRAACENLLKRELNQPASPHQNATLEMIDVAGYFATLLTNAVVSVAGKGDVKSLSRHLSYISQVKQSNFSDCYDINGDSGSNYTPALVAAAKSGSVECIDALIQSDAAPDVNARGIGGQTALIWAVNKNNEACVKRLLAVDGVNVNAQATIWVSGHLEDRVYISGCTALRLAYYQKNTRLFRLLLAHPTVDVNLRDANGKSVVALAAADGEAQYLEWLLENKSIDVNAINSHYRIYNITLTPLMAACRHGRETCVSLLLSRKEIEVNAVCSINLETSLFSGHSVLCQTALDLATAKGYDRCVSLILNAPNLKSSDMRQALVVAKKAGATTCAYLIEMKLGEQALSSESDTIDMLFTFKRAYSKAIASKALENKNMHTEVILSRAKATYALANALQQIFLTPKMRYFSLKANTARIDLENSVKADPSLLAAYYNDVTINQRDNPGSSAEWANFESMVNQLIHIYPLFAEKVAAHTYCHPDIKKSILENQNTQALPQPTLFEEMQLLESSAPATSKTASYAASPTTLFSSAKSGATSLTADAKTAIEQYVKSIFEEIASASPTHEELNSLQDLLDPTIASNDEQHRYLLRQKDLAFQLLKRAGSIELYTFLEHPERLHGDVSRYRQEDLALTYYKSQIRMMIGSSTSLSLKYSTS